MRARFWLTGAALAAVAIAGWLSSSGAAPAEKVLVNKLPDDDRDEINNKLMSRVTIDKLENVSLKEALEILSEKFQIALLVDANSFTNDAGAAALNAADEEAILKRQVNLPAMKKVRLATVLKHLADQIDGVYLVYPDHIKFVSLARAHTLISPLPRLTSGQNAADPDPADAPMEAQNRLIASIPLVNVNLVDRPLSEALKEVEVRTNRSIALASQAGEKSKTSITTRFTNVPVDTAVATLAEMAGLKMARKGNVLLVTTPERAKEFDPPPAAPVFQVNNMPFNNPWIGQQQGAMAATNEQVEELKKKVAELEKLVNELKAKK